MDDQTVATDTLDTSNLFTDGLFTSTLAPFDLITSLVGEYRQLRTKIETIASFIADDHVPIGYFIKGNIKDDRGVMTSTQTQKLFTLKPAIAALDADFWDKAMKKTDVLDIMPQARRDEWYKHIHDHTTPEFEENVVRDTFAALMASRAQFVAERVDGIFKGLSGEHVTNRPEGFGKRMIIANVLRMDYPDSHYTGLINDLRCVIAKLMHRDEPDHYASDRLVRSLQRQYGELVSVDGGALKMRLYKKGTAHIEVHTDIAWRLNMILAHLYPRAIPPQFRERPKKQPKDVPLMQRPLPFAVVTMLVSLEPAYTRDDNALYGRTHTRIPNAVQFPFSSRSNAHALQEAERVLESLGAVRISEGWLFDYPPQLVLDEVCANGCIPDYKAYQFYPTPSEVADEAVEAAKAGTDSTARWLEPSAGLGALADRMPKSQTICVEVAALRAKVLQSKGYNVVQDDFLKFAATTTSRFDRIVMNPPFDQGRWQAHLQAAASLLRPSGRIVAILPPSAKGKAGELVPGLTWTVSRTFDNAFAGTSVSVVVMVGEAGK